jgi:hypothetical protein
MRKDKKFNPIVYSEGVILGAIIAIGILSSIGLALYNWFRHL